MRMPTIHHRRVGLAAVLGFALVASPLVAAPALANTGGTGVVISEVYGAGGNSGAVFNRDFVELFNPTNADISLDNTSVQYRSASGMSIPSGVIPLSGSIEAGGYYLVGAGAVSSTNGAAVPTPNAADSTVLLAAGAGTVFLASGTTALSAPPVGSITGNPAIIDLVGYGTSNTFETAPTAAPSTTVSVQRAGAGADTDSNVADFTTATPTPTAGAVIITPPADPVAHTIEEIQGTGPTSPLVGTSVITTGVVTAAYPAGGFSGYYIQAPATGGALDSSHAGSDAVFIYSPSVAIPAIGAYVQVTGGVSEYNGTTEVTATAAEPVSGAVTAPTPVTTEVPISATGREALEGMLIAPAGAFTITDNYDTNYYGSIGLNPGTAPLITPTQAVEPGAAAIAQLAENTARLITLDDGASINFNSTANKGIELPYLSNTSPVRIGAAVTFTKPVILEYRNSLWNFQPTQQLTTANAATVQPATFENTRTDAPKDVGGDVTLASFNVLNYFTTTGADYDGTCSYYDDRAGNHVTVDTCSGTGPRGAANPESLARQQAKIVAAINKLGADVVSLEEIENSNEVSATKERDSALGTLVAALNAATGTDTWASAPSPTSLPAAQDVIRTAFIYKKAVVKTVGGSVILDDPAFVNARQPLAQEFQLVGGSASSAFLAIVNHFKSKGSAGPLAGDADTGDGQGASNASRVAQANALVAFANSLKSSTGVSKVLLSGDFNAYLKEDPIDVLVAAGYTDLGSSTGKSTYAFDGAVGSLDHILASTDAVAAIAGVDEWNINSVESVALEYSRYNYNALNLYQPDQFRASDHDPILVGLTLATAAPTPTPTPTSTPPVPTPTPTPPISSITPRISGDASIGSKLTVVTGTWQPAPVKLSLQWLRNGKAISGATGHTYTTKKSDLGDRISVRVTGVKAGYTTTTRVSASEKILRAFTKTPKPKVSGTAKVGKKLTAIAGRWAPAKVALHYQWYRNGLPITNADHKTYTLKKADRGDRITVRVTGSKKGYLSESETATSKRIR